MNALQEYDAEFLSTCRFLVGVDEAGRGALAGPVFAAACVLDQSFFENSHAVELSRRINDSKQISPAGRADQLEIISDLAAEGVLDFAFGDGSVAEINTHNILGATKLAMRRSVEQLAGRATQWSLPNAFETGPLFRSQSPLVRLIIDGRPLLRFPYAHEGIVKGDEKSLAIAIASIVAKVNRDREMARLAKFHPGYGFETHKGYGTKAHRAAILSEGPSPIHRDLFLRKILV